MKRDNLDNIDVKILKTLQKNGRVTNVELAEKVDLSAPPCLRRVRSLEEKGFITNSRDRGILLRPDSDFNRKIIEDLHPMEQKSMINLLHRFCSYMNDEPK